jgi:hypothetical protein
MIFLDLYSPWFRPMGLHVKEIRNSTFMKAYHKSYLTFDMRTICNIQNVTERIFAQVTLQI